MTDRLPAKLEATAIMRRVEAEGGFATVLNRGDPDRGALTLLVAERGRLAALLERRPDAAFNYVWTDVSADGPQNQADWRDFVEKRRLIDPDIWLIELDVADAQRFIAETIVSG